MRSGGVSPARPERPRHQLQGADRVRCIRRYDLRQWQAGLRHFRSPSRVRAGIDHPAEQSMHGGSLGPWPQKREALHNDRCQASAGDERYGKPGYQRSVGCALSWASPVRLSTRTSIRKAISGRMAKSYWVVASRPPRRRQS